MDKEQLRRYLTPAGAAQLLKLTPIRVRQMCDEGTLETVRLGNGQRLINPASVDAEIARRREAAQASGQ